MNTSSIPLISMMSIVVMVSPLFGQPKTNATLNYPKATPQEIEYVGRWKVLNGNGRVMYFIDVHRDGHCTRTDYPEIKGQWEFVGNELEIIWKGGVVEYISRDKDNKNHIKSTFYVGKTYTDTPDVIKTTTK